MFCKIVTTALLVCLVNVVYQCEAGVIKELPEESLSTVSPTENGTELPTKALKEVKKKSIGGAILIDENDKGIEFDAKYFLTAKHRCAPEESFINGKCQKDSLSEIHNVPRPSLENASRCGPDEEFLYGGCRMISDS